MRISELIRELASQKAKHGDVRVMLTDGGARYEVEDAFWDEDEDGAIVIVID